MYVEAKLANNPFYKPACETSWGSCSTVFKSEFAHILSHWGVVPKGHPMDLSLAAAGIIVYSLYLLYPTPLFRVFPKPHVVLLALSIGGLTETELPLAAHTSRSADTPAVDRLYFLGVSAVRAQIHPP